MPGWWWYTLMSFIDDNLQNNSVGVMSPCLWYRNKILTKRFDLWLDIFVSSGVRSTSNFSGIEFFFFVTLAWIKIVSLLRRRKLIGSYFLKIEYFQQSVNSLRSVTEQCGRHFSFSAWGCWLVINLFRTINLQDCHTRKMYLLS